MYEVTIFKNILSGNYAGRMAKTVLHANSEVSATRKAQAEINRINTQEKGRFKYSNHYCVKRG